MLVLLALLLPAAVDATREPRRQLGTRLALWGLRVYHIAVSPELRLLGVRCRFRPSCSRYARDVVAEWGLARGLPIVVRRLLRCGPWTAVGTLDPPPRRGTSRGPSSPAADDTPMASEGRFP